DLPLPANRPRGMEMLYSSGTTGRPKGVKPPLPNRRVDEPGDSFIMVLGAVFGVSADDVYLSPAPLYHAAPLRWCGAVQAYGGTVVVMESFDARAALSAVTAHGVTVLQMVPTMFVRLLQLPDDVRAAANVSTLRL